MKALLIKDFYVLLSQAKIFFAVIVVLSILNESSLALMGVLFGAMLPITAIAYDERSNFTKLSKVYPYATWEITLEKYLLGYICVGVSCILVFVAQSIFNGAAAYSIPVNGLLIGMICIAIILPFMFRFGAEKGRLFFIIGVFAISFVGNLINKTFNLSQVFLQANHNNAVLFIGVVLLNLLSVWCAIQINSKK